MADQAAPFFTVSIPTRDRPETFRKALDSVLAQSFKDYQVIVVDDGSAPEHRDAMETMKADYPDHIIWHHLPRRSRGHGHPYARNTAADMCASPYVATLDDDDVWVDTDHLAHAHARLSQSGDDLYLTDQEAYKVGTALPAGIWIEELAHRFRPAPENPGLCHTLTVDDALSTGNFAHLNCMIYARSLYQGIGGMDETLRYEPDRDLYMRLVDGAKKIAYRPHVIGHHFVPDQRKKANVSTQSNAIQKLIFQIRVDHKLATQADTSQIRKVGRDHLAISHKKLAEQLLAAGRIKDAAYYARSACLIGFNLKWFAFTTYLTLRSFVSSR